MHCWSTASPNMLVKTRGHAGQFCVSATYWTLTWITRSLPCIYICFPVHVYIHGELRHRQVCTQVDLGDCEHPHRSSTNHPHPDLCGFRPVRWEDPTCCPPSYMPIKVTTASQTKMMTQGVKCVAKNSCNLTVQFLLINGLMGQLLITSPLTVRGTASISRSNTSCLHHMDWWCRTIITLSSIGQRPAMLSSTNETCFLATVQNWEGRQQLRWPMVFPSMLWLLAFIHYSGLFTLSTNQSKESDYNMIICAMNNMTLTKTHNVCVAFLAWIIHNRFVGLYVSTGKTTKQKKN